MIRQDLYLERYDWEVVVFYDSTEEDAREILAALTVYEVDRRTLASAASNLYAGARNTGLTYSNLDERRSVVVLSRTTGRAQFANTWQHEVTHLVDHIAAGSGMWTHGEEIAHLAGDIAMAMQPVAARLMCPTCE